MKDEPRICPKCNTANESVMGVCRECKAVLPKSKTIAPDGTMPSKTKPSAAAAPPPQPAADGNPGVVDGGGLYTGSAFDPTRPESRAERVPAGGYEAIKPRIRRRDRVATWLRRHTRQMILMAAAVGAFGALSGGLFYRTQRQSEEQIKNAVVQVRCGGKFGSGFFVEIADHTDDALVATAASVVRSGDQVTVVRWFEKGTNQYSIAYPDVDVVAFDPVADIALLKLNNVPPDHRVAAIPLDPADTSAGPAVAYGFSEKSKTAKGNFRCAPLPVSVMTPTDIPFRDPDVGEKSSGKMFKALVLTGGGSSGNEGWPVVRYASSFLGRQFDGRVIGMIVTPHPDDKSQNATTAKNFSLPEGVIPQMQASTHKPSTNDVEQLIRRIIDSFLTTGAEKLVYSDFVRHLSLTDTPYLSRYAHELASLFSVDSESAVARLRFILPRLDSSPNDFVQGHSAVLHPTVIDRLKTCVPERNYFSDSPIDSACETRFRRALAYDLMKSLLRFEYADPANPNNWLKSGADEYKCIHIDDGPDADGRWKARIKLRNENFTIHVKHVQGGWWIPLFDPKGELVSLREDTIEDNSFEGKWQGYGSKQQIEVITRANGRKQIIAGTFLYALQVDPTAESKMEAVVGGWFYPENGSPCPPMEVTRQKVHGRVGNRVADATLLSMSIPTGPCSVTENNRIPQLGVLGMFRLDDKDHLRVFTLGGNVPMVKFNRS